jgi:hypothetical protein
MARPPSYPRRHWPEPDLYDMFSLFFFNSFSLFTLLSNISSVLFLKSQFQLTNANGQPTLLPMMPTSANGFHHHLAAAAAAHHHPHHGHHAQNMHMQQAFIDSSGLIHQVSAASTVSPGAAAATANGLLAPQQRTDRLPVCLSCLLASLCAYYHFTNES